MGRDEAHVAQLGTAAASRRHAASASPSVAPELSIPPGSGASWRWESQRVLTFHSYFHSYIPISRPFCNRKMGTGRGFLLSSWVQRCPLGAWNTACSRRTQHPQVMPQVACKPPAITNTSGLSKFSKFPGFSEHQQRHRARDAAGRAGAGRSAKRLQNQEKILQKPR